MKISLSWYFISTAESSSDGGVEDEWLRKLSSNRGKAFEKKARGPPLGKVEMTWLARGAAVDGQVEWQMLDQRLSWAEWWRRVVEQHAAEASAGPSRRVRMWDSMISGCKVENPAAGGGGGEFISGGGILTWATAELWWWFLSCD